MAMKLFVININNFPENSISLTPFSSSPLSLTVPSSLIRPYGSSLLVITENSRPIFSPFKEPSFGPASGVVSANYFVNKTLTPLSDLPSPILLQIPLLASTPSVQRLTEAVFSSSPSSSKDRVIANKQLQCLFFDEASRSLSEEGCSVSDFSNSTVTCSCTHLTDFMAFVSSSLDTLQSSNYSVLLALADLSPSTLLSNIGFFFTVTYFGSFLIFTGLLVAADYKFQNAKNLKSLFKLEQTQSQNETTPKETGNSSFQKFQRNSFNPSQVSQFTFTTNETAENLEQTPQMPKGSIGALYGSAEEGPSSIKITDIPTEVRKPSRPSFAQNLRASLLTRFEKSKRRKGLCCCVCLCCSLMHFQLSSNNQIYNLCAVSSLLSPRPLRLCLIYLGLLLDFSFCALFFNLNPHQEQSVPFFWEGFIADFWVALFTVLFALPPLLLLALCFRPPSQLKSKIDEATSMDELTLIVKQAKRNMRSRTALGASLFVAVSCFCCVYLIAFAQVANSVMSRDWLASSSLSVLIELVAFEVLPALAVGFLGLVYLGCKMRCVIWILVVVEFYRFIRNFVDT